MKLWSAVALTTALLFSVTACSGNGGVSRALGLSKQAPDEFLVKKTKPLSFPQQSSVLPVPGTPDTSVTAAADSGRSTLIGPTAGTISQPESSEAALLEAASINSQTREVSSEAVQPLEPSRSEQVVGNTLFGDVLGVYDDQQGDAIDPEAELQRLRDEGLIGPES